MAAPKGKRAATAPKKNQAKPVAKSAPLALAAGKSKPAAKGGSAKRAPASATRSAKKAAVKAPVKKSAAKRSVAKKAAAKPPVAKKAAAKPLVAKKALANKLPAKRPPAEKLPAKKIAVRPPASKPPIAKPAIARKPAVKAQARSTPARDALSTLASKRAIKATLGPADDGKAVVDAYFRDVDHPFKAEMEAVRQIILGVSPKISERIKWNAPSFFYKEDLGAFHPRATEFAHLILLFPGGDGMEAEDGLLEGNHKDRREAKFRSLDEVMAKKQALEQLVERWIALRDR